MNFRCGDWGLAFHTEQTASAKALGMRLPCCRNGETARVVVVVSSMREGGEVKEQLTHGKVFSVAEEPKGRAVGCQALASDGSRLFTTVCVHQL